MNYIARSLLLGAITLSYWIPNPLVVGVLTMFAGWEVWNQRNTSVSTDDVLKMRDDIASIQKDVKSLAGSTSTLSMYLNGNGRR